ncbi:MAG: hypothetical protein JXJ19_05840 [Elusimicrobia bacterium]|nr:hypothetical protein [Elusimicrobiota bacterium]
MNRQEFRNKHIRMLAVGGGLGLFFIIMLVLVMVKPLYRKKDIAQEELKITRSKLLEYNRFVNTITEFENKEKQVKDIINEFYSRLVPREDMEQGFLEILGDISKKTNISTDKMEPVGSSISSDSGYEKQIWNISFTADYKEIVNFINLLEKNIVFFGIENINLRSGKEKYRHYLDLSIYTVIPTPVDTKISVSKYDIYKSTMILGLPSDTYRIVENMEKTIDKSDQMYDISRDPMAWGTTIFPEEAKPQAGPVKQKEVETAPSLSLDGIIWDPQNPMVIVNGELLSKGGSVRGATVVTITQKSVTLKWKTQYIKLNLKEGG